jgi:hypothetical protein
MARTGILPVIAGTSEYGEVEHQLQILLGVPRLKIQECYDLRNPRTNAQFLAVSRAIAPQNIVTAFVPTSQVKQSIDDIHSRGLRIDPQAGFRVRVGAVDIDRSLDYIEVLRLSVALGNVLNYQENAFATGDLPFRDEPFSSRSLPPGYDSLRVSADGDYVVFTQSQIHCCNLVMFEGGANLAESPEDGRCDLCRSKLATVWCVNDSAKLCDECDRQSHINPIHEKHTRMSLPDA